MNKHLFEPRFVRAVYKAISEAGVDYMEIGYRNSKKLVPTRMPAGHRSDDFTIGFLTSRQQWFCSSRLGAGLHFQSSPSPCCYQKVGEKRTGLGGRWELIVFDGKST